MLETSKDLFWLVLSFVILWIGIVIGWSGIYIALMLRDIKKISGSFRQKLEIIDQILTTIKKRVETTANYLPPLIEGAEKLVEHYRERKAAKNKRHK